MDEYFDHTLHSNAPIHKRYSFVLRYSVPPTYHSLFTVIASLALMLQLSRLAPGLSIAISVMMYAQTAVSLCVSLLFLKSLHS